MYATLTSPLGHQRVDVHQRVQYPVGQSVSIFVPIGPYQYGALERPMRELPTALVDQPLVLIAFEHGVHELTAIFRARHVRLYCKRNGLTLLHSERGGRI